MIGDLIKPPPDEDGPHRVRLYRTPLYKRRWLRAAVYLMVAAVFVGCLGLLIILKPHRDKALGFDLEAMRELERATVILDRTGSAEIGRIYFRNREPVAVDDVPFHVIQALVATEDSRYYTHSGVDYMGIVRAFLKNLKPGGYLQGGSTITQQLARQAFELRGKTLDRKLTEAFLAHRIEQHYSKTEILEFYLNRIYFGASAYGIEAASQSYFGKQARDLTIDEGAVLVGLIKSPNRLSPLRDLEESRVARDYVLGRMRDEKMITDSECERLLSLPLIPNPKPTGQNKNYAEAHITELVIAELGEEEAQKGGYRIFTTIDAEVQKAAEASLARTLARVESETPSYDHALYADFAAKYSKVKSDEDVAALGPPEYLQGAVLMIDNQSGAVRAMVGGRDYRHSSFNRAIQGRKPAGTAFKPFVYAAAFDGGDKFPGSLISGAPVDNRSVMIGGLTGLLGEWGGETTEGNFFDKTEVSARDALVHGNIAPAVRLGNEIGIDRVTELVHDAGIESEMRPYPSMFLGASEVSLSEMCLGYSIFPNLGRRPEGLHLIETIRDRHSQVVFAHQGTSEPTVEVVDPVAAYQVHSCLEQALAAGAGAPAGPEFGLKLTDEHPAAGKTGTHYGSTDLWFMGYNSRVTCGVWVGFDNYNVTIYDGAFSNRIALPVWVDTMNASISRFEPGHFDRPEGTQSMEICTVSGLRATENCYENVTDEEGNLVRQVRTTFSEIVRPGDQLHRYCNVHTEGGSVPATLRVLTDSPPPLDVDRRGAASEPIAIQGLTVVGNDPYRSERPALRPRVIGEDSGDDIQKALIVPPTKLGSEKARIRLEPPKPLTFE